MNELDIARLVALDRHRVWHPFTPMQEWARATPLLIERAEGNYLFDVAGRRYLDAVSSLWVNVHGHNHPAINAAIRAQLDRVAHSTLLGLSHPTAIELADRLARLAPPGLEHVFYSDSGSTAVEVALKIAFQYWQLIGRPEKRRFVHLGQAYHGDTLGAVAVGGIDLFHRVFGPLLIDTISVAPPHPFRHDLTDPEAVRDHTLGELRRIFSRHGGEVAAFIIEPLMQGAAGMLVQPAGFLAGVAALCREFDILLVADEVATGFGRTGTMFACEQESVAPDILCVAKGLTGGYLPLAATLATSRIFDAFLGPRSAGKTFFHGHTYTGNPLACAAALASLDLFASEAVLERVQARSATLGRLLAAQVRSLRWVGDIRQRGLMVGIELVEEGTRSFHVEQFIGVQVCDHVRTNGVILRPLGDVIVLMPPLSITEDELTVLVNATADSIAAVCQK